MSCAAAREYQKESIRTVLGFLLGGKYPNLRELARENFEQNPELEQRFGSWAGMERYLQLPDQLSCSIDQATRTVSEIIRYQIVPTAIEFMERNSFELAEAFTQRELSFRNAAAHVLIALDGNQSEALDEEQNRVGEICEKNGAYDVLVANTPSARVRMWEGRKCLFEAANRVGSMYKQFALTIATATLISACISSSRPRSSRSRGSTSPWMPPCRSGSSCERSADIWDRRRRDEA
jgi:hypothetical protein